MILNSRPYIVGEVGIDCCSRFGGQQRDALRDGAAWRERSMDHGDRLLAVLDYDLRTGADPGQQPSEVAGRLRFRDVDHMVSHGRIIASLACRGDDNPLGQELAGYVRPTATSTNERCVHCLRVSETITYDHGLPASWYPDTTPDNVQRWTAPSCQKCNGELGRLERDLLIRAVLCIDPKKKAISGLAPKVFRSLGLDAEGLSERDKLHRDRLRSKLKAELIPYPDIAGGPGAIPGLGPYENSPWAVPIPWASLSIVAEKMARVCEHKIRGRYVEGPYGVRISVDTAGGIVPAPLAPFAKVFDFGPGFKVTRLYPIEDPLIVRYWISIWDTLHLRAYIDLEEELRSLDVECSRVEGLMLGDDQRSMRISPYLRNMS